MTPNDMTPTKAQAESTLKRFKAWVLDKNHPLHAGDTLTIERALAALAQPEGGCDHEYIGWYNNVNPDHSGPICRHCDKWKNEPDIFTAAPPDAGQQDMARVAQSGSAESPSGRGFESHPVAVPPPQPQTVDHEFTPNDFDLCCVGKDQQGYFLFALDEKEIEHVKNMLINHTQRTLPPPDNSEALKALDSFVKAFKLHANIKPEFKWEQSSFGIWEKAIRSRLSDGDDRVRENQKAKG